ncbi:hypothetical protein BFP70_06090 [Thioclava sp. SK-1]|nr:hypothetical protein BFP70_06090 [Thioclava sp. SK-1]
MTKRGEAGRALSAGVTTSVIDSIFGAFVVALSVPLIRPFVLSIGTPELLAMTVFGIAMVSALSGSAPLRGVVAACFGILVAMIGIDNQTGTVRWAGDVLYLWNGVPGSAAQATLLGALIVHGFVPGRELLTTNLSVTYTLVWPIALANISVPACVSRDRGNSPGCPRCAIRWCSPASLYWPSSARSKGPAHREVSIRLCSLAFWDGR